MADKLYTTNQLAKLFGVVPTTVIDWIERSKLEAFKTLGGHRRITHSAVLRFLRENRLPFPPAFAEEQPRLLVLSDDVERLKTMGDLLAAQIPEAQIFRERHPVEALVRIGAERPQVVVLDLRLQSMDPFDLCQHLRVAGAENGPRLLAVAADDSPDVQGRALQSGADATLPGSRIAEELATRCRALLSPARANG